MREIKFRGFHPNENGTKIIYIDGKEIKGEWVYGSLNQWISNVCNHGERQPNKSWIRENDSTTRWGIRYPVIPETIGQYTGLKDKTDTKIFEGDIVVPDWISPCGDADGSNYDKKGEIKYLCGGYYIVPQYEHKVLLSNFVKEEFIGYRDTVGEIYEFKNNVALVDVIGNIYDNKELLEEV